MLEQVQSLIDSIDRYKELSAQWVENGQEVRELILESIEKIWRILWHNGVNIWMIMDTLEKSDTIADGEYGKRMSLLNESVVRGTQMKEWLKQDEIKRIIREAKLDFIKSILSFFGLPNVELFIARGTIRAIERPIVQTKIRTSVLLRAEKKEARKNRIPKWLNLDGVSSIVSIYEATHSSLLDRQSAIRNIIDNELIAPLAEQGPFKATERYRKAVAAYIKSEEKSEEIARAERRVQQLEILAWWKSRKRLDAMLKRARVRLEIEIKRYNDMRENTLKSEPPLEISSLVHDVIREFWILPSKRKIHPSLREAPLITSDRIIWKLKRAMAIVVHNKFPELKKLRTNQWEIQKMIQRFEGILLKYQSLLMQSDTEEWRKTIIINMRVELDDWEERSNHFLEEYSIRNIRTLRNEIIESLTSTI